MARRSLRFALAIMLLTRMGHPQTELRKGTVARFATVDEGRAILTAHDEFVKRMSPFDRALRMKTDKDVSVEDYLAFVGKQVRDWTDDGKAKIESGLEAIAPRLQELALPFPETIYLIQTTGEEEGRAAYTRDNAIVLPRVILRWSNERLQNLLAHELFHVLTRANPELRQRLYEAIAFEKCGDVEFPAALRSRRITNPDAPWNDHCIQVKTGGTTVTVVPILFSRAEKYDVERGGGIFQYLQFKLLEIERPAGGTPEPAYRDGKPRLLDVGEVSGFYEKVGSNTQYIIHPEEILAENFALIVTGRTAVASPEILQKIHEALSEGKASKSGGQP